MTEEKAAFCEFLRKLIKESGMTQFAFYSAVGITKPYFYDILSGKVNPPPPEIQYKMLEILQADEPTRREFLNLAAAGRAEIPADIVDAIKSQPQKMDEVRDALMIMLKMKI